VKVKLLDKLSAAIQLIVVPVFEGKLPLKAIRDFSGLKKLPAFAGKYKQRQILYDPDGERQVLLLGLGKASKQSLVKLCTAFRSAVKNESSAFQGKCALYAKGLSENVIFAAANGFKKSPYSTWELKSEKNKTKHPFASNAKQLSLLEGDASQKKAALEGIMTAESQLGIMDLMDRPANYKKPQFLAEYAKKSAKKYGYKVTVLKGKALEKEGLHALLSVNAGSEEPAVLIKMEYAPPKSKKGQRPQLALVGKGITFDTGGISLKAPNNMHYMKSDMGGAGAVLGAVELAAKLKLNVSVVGIIPSTENCIDGKSTMPGNLISSYSGKTIEVIDTDAEGRLILADAVPYTIKKYNPEIVIDLATLTGSAVRALGYSAAALFSDDPKLVSGLQKSADQCGERVWHMPLYDDYLKMIKSDVADIRNLGSSPLAGASVAAKFIEYFTDNHPHWAHLDIAGVAFGDSEFSGMKAGTAWGVKLLVEFMKTLESK